MKTIEELLRECENRGLKVRIWCQREVRKLPHLPDTETKWWCELQHKNGFNDSDWGLTAAESLSAALDRAKGLKGPESRNLDGPVPAPVKMPDREMAAPKTPPKQASFNLDSLD